MIAKGRIIKAAELATVDDHPTFPNSAEPQRVLRRETVAGFDALEVEKRRVSAELAEMRAAAEQDVLRLRQLAVEEGRKQGYAELVSQLLRVKALEANVEKATQERVIGLARLLAERLLEKSLELAPSLVLELAASALAEVRGARKVQLFVSPVDEAQIAPELARLAIPPASVTLHSDAELTPGQLRVVTELGTFEANLGLRLDALCRALKAGGSL